MKPQSRAPATRATRTRKFLFLFGAAWVFAGALLKWDAPWLYVLLVFTVLAALWVGRQQQPAILRVLLLLALVFPAWKIVNQWRTRAAVHGNVAVGGDDAAVIRALVTAEETDLRLSPKMSALSKGLLNLRLPGPGTESVFAPSVTVSDVGLAPAITATGAEMAEARTWPVAKDTKEVAKVDLWRPLLDGVSWFEHAKVYIISGEHPDGDVYRYEAKGGFEALAKMKSGEWCSLHGKMKLSWHRAKGTGRGPAPGGEKNRRKAED